MKSLGVILAAGAAVLVVLGLRSQATAPVYAPPTPQPAAKPWYDQALGFLGTVAGNALGTFASMATRPTAVPVKSASGPGVVPAYPGTTNTSINTIEDTIKRGMSN